MREVNVTITGLTNEGKHFSFTEFCYTDKSDKDLIASILSDRSSEAQLITQIICIVIR